MSSERNNKGFKINSIVFAFAVGSPYALFPNFWKGIGDKIENKMTEWFGWLVSVELIFQLLLVISCLLSFRFIYKKSKGLNFTRLIIFWSLLGLVGSLFIWFAELRHYYLLSLIIIVEIDIFIRIYIRVTSNFFFYSTQLLVFNTIVTLTFTLTSTIFVWIMVNPTEELVDSTNWSGHWIAQEQNNSGDSTGIILFAEFGDSITALYTDPNGIINIITGKKSNSDSTISGVWMNGCDSSKRKIEFMLRTDSSFLGKCKKGNGSTWILTGRRSKSVDSICSINRRISCRTVELFKVHIRPGPIPHIRPSKNNTNPVSGYILLGIEKDGKWLTTYFEDYIRRDRDVDLISFPSRLSSSGEEQIYIYSNTKNNAIGSSTEGKYIYEVVGFGKHDSLGKIYHWAHIKLKK